MAVQLNNIVGQKTEIEISAKTPESFEVILKEKKKGIYLVTVVFEDRTKELKRIVVN